MCSGTIEGGCAMVLLLLESVCSGTIIRVGVQWYYCGCRMVLGQESWDSFLI